MYFLNLPVSFDIAMSCSSLAFLLLFVSTSPVVTEVIYTRSSDGVVEISYESDLDSVALRSTAPLHYGHQENTFGLIHDDLDRPRTSDSNAITPRSPIPVETRKQSRERREQVRNDALQAFMVNEAVKQRGAAHQRNDAMIAIATEYQLEKEALYKLYQPLVTPKTSFAAFDVYHKASAKYEAAISQEETAAKSMSTHGRNIENIGFTSVEMQRRMQTHAMPLANVDRLTPARVRLERKTPVRKRSGAKRQAGKMLENRKIGTRKRGRKRAQRTRLKRLSDRELEPEPEPAMKEKRSRLPPPPNVDQSQGLGSSSRADRSSSKGISSGSSSSSSSSQTLGRRPSLTPSEGELILVGAGKHAKTVEQAETSLRQYKTAKDAENRHWEEAERARKRVREKGVDIEHIGMVNKNLHMRMRRHFPPLVNVNARAEKELLRTKQARLQRERIEAGRREAEAIAKKVAQRLKSESGPTRVVDHIRKIGTQAKGTFTKATGQLRDASRKAGGQLSEASKKASGHLREASQRARGQLKGGFKRAGGQMRDGLSRHLLTVGGPKATKSMGRSSSKYSGGTGKGARNSDEGHVRFGGRSPQPRPSPKFPFYFDY